MELDALDKAILALLQDNSRLTSEAIADAVALSPTAVQRRIKRLRDTGAIVAEVAIVAPRAVGRGLTAIVGVELARGGSEVLIDAFKQRMAARPEVQQCYYVAGPHDFMLIVTAVDVADYERLSRELFFGDPNIRKFQTTFVLEAVKVGQRLPIS
ncbi:Lrp/AsnC family transcriptional regulator [Corallococcus llansteffanensis]|uniref:Lrp/AsnC family transcriptional regulator n=1 Tax=Corallococcus llansteffanensis TaxID=2316731 RepID=A0A3A8P0J2_9BACT|nr:Lrp/AsnC family transcriptional regulator [Corallococcus llansteffanensis]RKH49309.1 Lrp/AsnC family transcriptional regulator [Corallococcus llansteffanensis]